MLVSATPTSCGHAPTRRQVITGGAIVVVGVAMRPVTVSADASDEISRTAETIHQERLFKANRKRVYEALTVTKQFDQITQLSGVMQSAAMSRMQAPTAINPHVGGSFALFGGHIVGRHVELVPNELIVQAWRIGNWDRGIYSIVRFQLTEQGARTKIIFNHTDSRRGKRNTWPRVGKSTTGTRSGNFCLSFPRGTSISRRRNANAANQGSR
jgi:uncharacterized protein YndB with AHSA1/START domain